MPTVKKINFSILYIISAETPGYLNIFTIKTSSTKLNYYIYVHGIVGIHFQPSYLDEIFWLMWFLSRCDTNSYWELHSQRIASNRLTLKCTPVLIIVSRKSKFKYFLATVSNQSTYIASWRNTWVKKEKTKGKGRLAVSFHKIGFYQFVLWLYMLSGIMKSVQCIHWLSVTGWQYCKLRGCIFKPSCIHIFLRNPFAGWFMLLK